MGVCKFIQTKGSAATGDGTIQGISASYSNQTGISPGIVYFNCMVDDTDKIPTDGTVIIGDGVNPNLVLKNCRVSQVVPTNSSDGNQVQIQIRDERWAWNKVNAVGGEFNRRDGDGSLMEPKRDLSDLLVDFMDALGKAGASPLLDGTTVLEAGIPEAVESDGTIFAKPYVFGQVDRPGEKFMNVLSDFGLVVTIDYDGTAHIWGVGNGDGTATGNYVSLSKPRVVIDPPATINVVTKFSQTKELDLTPVVLDTDGTLYEIDGTPSYRDVAKNDWNASTGSRLKMEADALLVPGASLQDAEDGTEKLKAAKAFSDSYARWFRLPATAVTDDGTVARTEYIRRLEPLLHDRAVIDGARQRLKPYVHGKHMIAKTPFDAPVPRQLKGQGRVETNFTLDKNLGIIKFSRPIVDYEASGKVKPADSLKYRCTIQVAPENLNKVYNYTWLDRDGSATGLTGHNHLVHRDDVDREDGTVAWETKCLGIAEDEQRTFWEGQAIATYVYPGIQKQWVCDGNISEVTFNMGSGETPLTSVSFGTELDINTLPEPTRLKMLRDRETADLKITQQKTRFVQPNQLEEQQSE